MADDERTTDRSEGGGPLAIAGIVLLVILAGAASAGAFHLQTTPTGPDADAATPLPPAEPAEEESEASFVEAWGPLGLAVLAGLLLVGAVVLGLVSPPPRGLARRLAPYLLVLGGVSLLVGVASFHEVLTLFEPTVYGPLVGATCLLGLLAALNLSHTELFGRRLAAAGVLVLNVVLAIALLVVVNAISAWWHTRWDLTSEGVYSLSERSADILGELSADDSIRIYDGLSSRMAQYDSARELLRQYEAASNRVSVERVNPFSEQANELFEELEMGRPPRSPFIIVQRGDRHRLIDQGELTEPDLSRGRQAPPKFAGESKLTTAIVELTSPSRTVWFLTGHGEGETGLGEGSGRAPGSLERSRSFRTLVELLRGQHLEVALYDPADHGGEIALDQAEDVLAILGPQRPFSDDLLTALEDWLARGGRLLCLLEPRRADTLESNETGLERVLEPYGIQPRLGRVAVRTRSGVSFGHAATFLGEHDINPLGAPLSEAVPFVDALPLELRDGGRATALLQVATGAVVDPEQQSRVLDREGPFYLGAAAERESPAGGARGQDEDGGDARTSRVVVFGDSTFASDQYIRIRESITLLANAVNWLTARTELITVQPKEPDRVQIQLDDEESGRLTAIAIFDLPLLVALLGLIVWFVRRK